MRYVLETPRLILRPIEAADIPVFVPLLNDYAVSAHLARVPHPYTEKDAHDFLKKMAGSAPSGGDYAFAIVRNNDNAYIGGCGVHPSLGWEIGYWLGRAFWGQGYASEAVLRLIRFAFEELGAGKLKAEWFNGNPASGRVLAKLGFMATGETMSNALARGHKVPATVVALDRAAFEARNRQS